MREKLKILAKRIKETRKNTENVRVKVKEKREQRKARQYSIAKEFGFSPESVPKRKKVKINARTVENWFKNYKKEYLGISKHGKWTVKQLTLGKRLLKEYGDDDVKKAVQYMCEKWDQILANTSLNGVPNVSLLWGMRESIFAYVETGKDFFKQNKTNIDEFVDDGKNEMTW